MIHHASQAPRRGRRPALPDRGQAEHRRQRRRHRAASTRRRRWRRAAAKGARARHRSARRWCRNTCRPADGRIVRVEVLDGKFLYAIRIYTTGDTFNLCPADVCQGVDGAELARAACPVDAPKNDLRVEGYTPPARSSTRSSGSWRPAGIEIGGVEYMIDAARRPARTSTTSTRSRTSWPTRRACSASIRSRGWPTGCEAELASRGTGVGRRCCMRFGYWLPVFGGWLRNVGRRGDGGDAGSTSSRLARRSEADRLRSHARRRAEPERHQGRRGAVARRVEHGGGAGGRHRAARDHGRGAARPSIRRRCSPSRRPTSIGSAADACR